MSILKAIERDAARRDRLEHFIAKAVEKAEGESNKSTQFERDLYGHVMRLEDENEELHCLIADTVDAARRLQIGDIDMAGFVAFLKFHFPDDWDCAVSEWPDPQDQAESKALANAMEKLKP